MKLNAVLPPQCARPFLFGFTANVKNNLSAQLALLLGISPCSQYYSAFLSVLDAALTSVTMHGLALFFLIHSPAGASFTARPEEYTK